MMSWFRKLLFPLREDIRRDVFRYVELETSKMSSSEKEDAEYDSIEKRLKLHIGQRAYGGLANIEDTIWRYPERLYLTRDESAPLWHSLLDINHRREAEWRESIGYKKEDR